MLKLLVAISMLAPTFAMAGDPHQAMGPSCLRMVLLGTDKTFAKFCVEMDTTVEKPYLIRIYRRDGSLAEHYEMIGASQGQRGEVTYYPTPRAMLNNELDEAVKVFPPVSGDAGIVSIKGDKFGLKNN